MKITRLQVFEVVVVTVFASVGWILYALEVDTNTLEIDASITQMSGVMPKFITDGVRQLSFHPDFVIIESDKPAIKYITDDISDDYNYRFVIYYDDPTRTPVLNVSDTPLGPGLR